MIMEGLSVYWNPDSASFANAENDGASINTLFVEGIASKTYRTVGYNYSEFSRFSFRDCL